MKRITPQEVLDAYKRTGKKPVRGSMDDGRGGCCAVGVLAIEQGWEWSSVQSADQILGISTIYNNGLTYGFDYWGVGYGLLPSIASRHQDWKDGFEDGKAIAAAVFA